MTELPVGWSYATIEELAASGGVTDGPFGSNLKTDHYTDAGPRVVRLQNIGDGVFRDEKAHISDEHFDRLVKHSVEPNDVLVASLGELLPRACLAPELLGRAIVKADCIRVRPDDAIHPSLLMWALNAPQTRERVGESIKGVGRPRVNLGELRSLELPVPPLAEQDRIVAAIDEAFSKLDAGEAGLRTVRQLLSRMRNAILAAAVTGQLVSQDPTEVPATKLLVDLGVTPGEGSSVPDGWAWTTVGDLLQRIEAGKSFATLGRPAGGEETGVIKVSAMTWGEFRPAENKAIPEGSALDERWAIRRGDLLFSRANTSEYVGACVIVPRDFPKLILSDKSLRLVPKEGLDPAWLQIFLRSRLARAQIEVLATGTKQSMRNISQSKLRGIRVAVPPPEEQVRIVAEVERQISDLVACERSAAAGLEVSAALRRSVLKAAFEGRLVPQDPTDEPASVLLERIRADRAATPKPKQRRVGATA